jgi:hypothetical protein
MGKKLIGLILVLVLSWAVPSHALVVGDFGGGLDGWAPAGDATRTPVPTGVTKGSQAILIEGPGGWQMLAKLDIKAFRSVLGVEGAAVCADVTAFAADMQTDWMNMEMIINGQNNDETGANADVAGIPLDTYDVHIGENSQQAGRFWDGSIDEVTIYNRALSAGEVAYLARK